METTASGATSGRWSLLLGGVGASMSWSGSAARTDGRSAKPDEDFFAALDRWAAEDGLPESGVPPDLPFCGGWFLLLGYELAAAVEPSLVLPGSPHRLPDGLIVRCAAAVVFDHLRQRTFLVAESPAASTALEADVEHITSSASAFAAHGALVLPASVEEDPPERYLEAVRRTLDYLRNGDIFQANLSRAWRGTLAEGVDGMCVYRRLRHANPAPFAASVRWHDSHLLSSSPERLLSIDGATAQVRPIAGTHARRVGEDEDVRQRGQLLASLKERAEHLMLIDLERNDLGRICRIGSIVVDERMVLESYAHVHHIVSNIRGELRPGIGPGAALRAVFPGGTITGCPKVRAMQIIAELEREGRGPYTGAVGYLSRCGHLDTSILIRSVVCQAGRYVLRAGAGIVADSDPTTELEETRAKARGLLLAMEADDDA